MCGIHNNTPTSQLHMNGTAEMKMVILAKEAATGVRQVDARRALNELLIAGARRRSPRLSSPPQYLDEYSTEYTSEDTSDTSEDEETYEGSSDDEVEGRRRERAGDLVYIYTLENDTLKTLAREEGLDLKQLMDLNKARIPDLKPTTEFYENTSIIIVDDEESSSSDSEEDVLETIDSTRLGKTKCGAVTVVINKYVGEAEKLVELTKKKRKALERGDADAVVEAREAEKKQEEVMAEMKKRMSNVKCSAKCDITVPETEDSKLEQLSDGEFYELLDGIVGQDAIKEQLNDLRNTDMWRLNDPIFKKQIKQPHFIIAGPPGTGKTTIARILAKIYRPNGVFVEATPDDFVAQFVGQTQPKTKAILQRASGGVLFIDEAYKLTSKRYGASDFSSVAINIIMDYMNADREETADAPVCVFAGYVPEMLGPDMADSFINANPGLSRRIRFKFVIEEPSREDVLTILKMKLDSIGIALDKRANSVLRKYIVKDKDLVLTNRNGAYAQIFIDEGIVPALTTMKVTRKAGKIKMNAKVMQEAVEFAQQYDNDNFESSDEPLLMGGGERKDEDDSKITEQDLDLVLEHTLAAAAPYMT